MGLRRGQTSFKFISLTAVLAAAVLAFQNCSAPGGAPVFSSSHGGTGADGMVFNSYDTCANNQVGVASSISITQNYQSALLTRQNCQDLAVPQALKVSDLKFAAGDSTVLQINGKVFDQQIGVGGQKVTLVLCASASVQSAIWSIVGSSSQLFGAVTQSNGSRTGILNVDPPVGAAGDYRAVSGQASDFDLQLGLSGTASLTYSIGGSSPTSVTGLVCASQKSPATPDDGSAAAPSGLAQSPALFNGYSARPPWKVAGVDYAVGFASGKVLKDPLTDAALAANPSVSIDSANKIVHVAGDNVVLDGYDFTLGGGYSVVVDSGQGTVIKNSNIGFVSTLAASTGLTVSNCVMDGTAATGWALISHRGAGALTVEYNWLRNFHEKAIEVDNGSTVVVKYNFMEKGSSNFLYLGPGSYSSVTVEFNTAYEPVSGTGTEGFSLYGPNLGFDGDVAYNTMITVPNGSTLAMSYLMHVGGSSGDTVSARVHDNYLDSQGAYGPFYSVTNGGGTTVLYTNNIDMATGQTIKAGP